MWPREEKKNAMLLIMMKQMELLTRYVKGFHAKNSHAIQNYDDGYYGNQGWNKVQFVDTSSQGSTEEGLNEVAFQMVTPMVANNTIQRKYILDDDVLEWEMEEEAIKELIVNVFLKGEEIEEIYHVKMGEKWDENQIDKPPLKILEARFKHRRN
ncbi:hypothetical protein HAX54_023052 [Datura stramonium]|uniref:Uncharacterized protein n=1 Tax=Datura stramonium TaxID=4076 RepID=A0ABS8S4E5_DATST|nr:hypothetical protein [Datura stramonium]